MKPISRLLVIIFFSASALMFSQIKAGGEALGTQKYENYDKPEFCGTSCTQIFISSGKQAMMSQAYTHHWDEIEYFKLAVPHAEKDEKVAEVKAGCNGCHAPISFFSWRCPASKARDEFKSK